MKIQINNIQRANWVSSNSSIIQSLKRFLTTGLILVYSSFLAIGCSLIVDGRDIFADPPGPNDSVFLYLFPILSNDELLAGLPAGTVGGLAYGDFDCDSLQDLAVGDPDQTVGNVLRAGAVHIFYGSGDTEVISANQLGSINQTDAFGFSVAAANFDNNECDDLAIGAPGFDSNSDIANVGRVYIVRGYSKGGLYPEENDSVIIDNSRSQSFFGTSLATGNFNDDDYADLAVGMPKAKVLDSKDAGAVKVFHGTSIGMEFHNFFSQADGEIGPFIKGDGEKYDLFGFSLASGDFDGNGFDDLAIGVPGECQEGWFDLSCYDRGGAVNVIYSLDIGSGLWADSDQIWTQASSGVKGGMEQLDAFGFSLAAGDFDGDGYKDLAIGVPGESTNNDKIKDAGAVNILYGGQKGLQADENKGASQNDQIWGQDHTSNTDGDIAGRASTKNFFGTSLATGNLNGDRYDELAIGVIQYDVDGEIAGAVNILLGSTSGLVARGSQILSQASEGVNEENPQTDDFFGMALAIGNFDGDVNDIGELAVRVNDGEACAAHVFYGVITKPIDNDELYKCSSRDVENPVDLLPEITTDNDKLLQEPPFYDLFGRPRASFGALQPQQATSSRISNFSLWNSPTLSRPVAPKPTVNPRTKGRLISKTSNISNELTYMMLDSSSDSWEESEMLFTPVDVGENDEFFDFQAIDSPLGISKESDNSSMIETNESLQPTSAPNAAVPLNTSTNYNSDNNPGYYPKAKTNSNQSGFSSLLPPVSIDPLQTEPVDLVLNHTASQRITREDADIVVPCPNQVISSHKPVACFNELTNALNDATPGTIIYIDDNAEINIGDNWNLPLKEGVVLASGRDKLVKGGLIYTDTFTKDKTKHMFKIEGPNVRVTGLRFRGPSSSTAKSNTGEGKDKVSGILIKKELFTLIDHNEFHHFTGAGVDVRGNWIEDQVYTPLNNKNSAKRIQITNNYFHHNQRQGSGYGVVVGYSAYAFIDRNVFDYNRHSIASDGRPKTGYRAHHNFVLSGGGRYCYSVSCSYEHHFDMHARGNEPHYDRGPAGEFLDISNNTFRGNQRYRLKNTRKALYVRGEPSDKIVFHNNTLVHTHEQSAVKVNPPSTVKLPGLFNTKIPRGFSTSITIPNKKLDSRGNHYGVNTAQELGVADMDGDGIDDVFQATGSAWYYSSAGRTEWRYLGTSDKRLKDLVLADFDGNGKADVFHANGKEWLVSKDGTEAWKPINTSTVTKGLRFGDFNNDGKTDIFRTSAGNWYISWGGKSAWIRIGGSVYTVKDLRFGDFNGDGMTDVFSLAKGQWSISLGGNSKWSRLNDRLSSSLGNLVFADFNGDGRTDIAQQYYGQWRVSWSGSQGWTPLRRPGFVTKDNINKQVIGDFTGDGRTDVLRYKQQTLQEVLRNEITDIWFEMSSGASNAYRRHSFYNMQ